MRGLTDLSAILASLNPALLPGEFVFCTLPQTTMAEVLALNPLGCLVEQEGLTVILRRETAEAEGLTFAFGLRCITLEVHSDLGAVGLTAAFSGRLAQCGISANVMAGAFHDHIFVASPDAEQALQALRDLQAEAARAQ